MQGSVLRPVFELPSSKTRKAGDVTVYTFPNGLTLIHRKNTNNEIVGLVTYIRTGSRTDDPAKAGLANLLMRVLAKGTKKRTADEIAEETALLGAALRSNAGQDFCTVSLQCINSDLEDAVELMADVLLHPTFPLDEVELERRRTLASIRIGNDQPAVVATKRFQEELFGTHPYALPVEGREETIPGITAQDLNEKHKADFVVSNMVVSAVGNVEFQRLRDILQKFLGEPMLEAASPYIVDKIVLPGAVHEQIFKESEQGYVALGHVTCPAGDADEPAVRVAAAILGAGMSSRLFSELRDKRGLAYSVGASPVFHELQGYLLAFIGTSGENLVPGEPPNPASIAEKGLWGEVRRLREGPVAAKEIDRAKNYIAGQYLRAHERNLQQATYLGYWHLMGRGVEYDEKFLDDINAVTSRDIMRVANKYFLEPTVVVLRPR